jgi:hypothetical protein
MAVLAAASLAVTVALAPGLRDRPACRMPQLGHAVSDDVQTIR